MTGAPRIAVLASGGGRSLENLVLRERAGSLPARISLVLSNRREAFVLERARRLGVPSDVLRPRDHEDEARYAAALEARLAAERIDLVVLAGYLARFPVHAGRSGRVINIHPALLPAFGGRGFYGTRVHEAVLAAGVKVSGCTVHFVDEEYDHGPIIVQRAVPVRFEDDAESLGARVFEAEKDALPEAITLYAAGRLRIEGARVRILPAP